MTFSARLHALLHEPAQPPCPNRHHYQSGDRRPAFLPDRCRRLRCHHVDPVEYRVFLFRRQSVFVPIGIRLRSDFWRLVGDLKFPRNPPILMFSTSPTHCRRARPITLPKVRPSGLPTIPDHLSKRLPLGNMRSREVQAFLEQRRRALSPSCRSPSRPQPCPNPAPPPPSSVWPYSVRSPPGDNPNRSVRAYNGFMLRDLEFFEGLAIALNRPARL